ncbi:helix-turn-helix domain-containing protein [Haloactinomyces albus]|uniref:Transcriptional regulator with XRE-family HTH domain n=1 Tax=Haloactinomyces albus TaxID=1352928 RepID=A0AAE3ZI97_9ACTN|nr:helix-turn-helix transcriptional regulator [Haloactinomyces albus]MDR7301628.1 transcriptional regulator with XRE-family HTH domain [Haloactinomyces albus]MDR7304670.1 transcriptional regulator with XRE-family HTH domain [Haloactinomyces albus]MDR7304680.1 transcriptional regulator with XRE-family HTH domain [Haloactinomyces albus]MDR7304690.1 transcriptional regulator with XRE-family HTH domain [Haloactinomyces albus]MDR7304698.1 transcriptional regulator with XRE-family HTH domain [Haloac
MPKDWAAVSEVIKRRMGELDMTQQELTRRADVAPMTVRELQNNLKPRKRSARTLAAISEALDLPSDHLSSVLESEEPSDSGGTDSLRVELEQVKQTLADLAERLEIVERRQAADDTRP